MAGNSIGTIFRLTSFGESHGPAIGGVIDGCPAGLVLDEDFIRREMNRRKTGITPASSSRQEDDRVEFLSGIFEGTTTGTPLAFMIRNKDHKSADYDHLKNNYRPSHADFTYDQKYGIRDYRGGGRASARETAVRVAGGAVAKLLLKELGIGLVGYVSQIGTIELPAGSIAISQVAIEDSPLRCPDPKTTNEMLTLLDAIKKQGDTVGGVISCQVTNVPPGLGEPVYDRFEADLAKAIMSINAVKAFGIGSGVEASAMRGSQHNDPFTLKDGKVSTTSNYSGGVQGGITNGQEILFKAYFKPVATLMQDQDSIDREGKKSVVKGKGRHDVCVVPRAVPIVEAMAALTLADFILRNRSSRL